MNIICVVCQGLKHITLTTGYKSENFFSLQFVPIEALTTSDSHVSLRFLSWFKQFFDANKKIRESRALEAQGGQSITPETGG